MLLAEVNCKELEALRKLRDVYAAKYSYYKAKLDGVDKEIGELTKNGEKD